MTCSNSSTTPEQMAALLEKYGSAIVDGRWPRTKIMGVTGLGESASRRLLALAHGGTTGKRVVSNLPPRAAAPAPTPEEPDLSQIRTDTAGDTQTVEAPKTRIASPEELLAAAGVDMTVWAVERATVNKWEMGSTPRRTGSDAAGWERASNDVQVTPLFAVKVWLKRRTDTLDIRQFKEDALAEIRAAASAVNRRAPMPLKPVGTSQLLYLGAHDVHVGKLALSAETLNDYTSEIAHELALRTLRELLQEASGHGIDRIVLPIGHDLMHVESGRNMTSRGTPQDVDGRYRVMRRKAYELTTAMVQACADHAPVDVIAVPGNHGYDSDLAVAERLEARFHDHPHVHVQVPLTPRSYYAYGTNLLGLTHGDGVRLESLPLIMADENPVAWGATTHREWLTGHRHAKQTYQVIQTETETRGVRVRILPSISAVDWWHAASGYSNVRAMEAYRYDVTLGYRGHHSVTVHS